MNKLENKNIRINMNIKTNKLKKVINKMKKYI